jgi:hypothetical protein
VPKALASTLLAVPLLIMTIPPPGAGMPQAL